MRQQLIIIQALNLNHNQWSFAAVLPLMQSVKLLRANVHEPLQACLIASQRHHARLSTYMMMVTQKRRDLNVLTPPAAQTLKIKSTWLNLPIAECSNSLFLVYTHYILHILFGIAEANQLYQSHIMILYIYIILEGQ